LSRLSRRELSVLESVAFGLHATLDRALRFDLIASQCTTVSLIGIVIIRVAAPSRQWRVAYRNGHCWIESEDGWVVDLTHRQFGEAARAVLILSPEEAARSDYAPSGHLPLELEEKFRRDLNPTFRSMSMLTSDYGRDQGPWVHAGPTGIKGLFSR
jgi:hypothetical protein